MRARAAARWRDDHREGRHIPRCNERRLTCAPFAGCCSTPDTSGRQSAATRRTVDRRPAHRTAQRARRGKRQPAQDRGIGTMKQDERNLPLSTDSAEAAALVRPRRRALPEIPHRHDVAGRQRARRRSRLCHGALPQGLPAAHRGEPRQSTRRSPRRSPPHRPTPMQPRSARSSMSPPSPPGRAANSTGPSRSGGRSSMPRRPICSRCASATPRGSATARHRRSANRPTASRHAGQPDLPGYDCCNASGPSRTRRPATTPPPNVRWMPRWNATAPTTSRITSRRTCWRWIAARARAATGSKRRSRTGPPATT